MAGVFTPSDELAKEIFAASELSGEKFWRLPLEESYWESMKSGVADMVNTGGRQGGAITAALFLKQVLSSFLFIVFVSFPHSECGGKFIEPLTLPMDNGWLLTIMPIDSCKCINSFSAVETVTQSKIGC